MINLKIEEPYVFNDFKRIADELMNNWILKINESNYRITEIEFYYSSPSHPDRYPHGHKQQTTNGCWYFHGSGIDITIGSEDSYGGILIRALNDLDRPGYYTYGPIKIITELFCNLKSVYDTDFSFGLVKDVNGLINKEKIIAAPRIGLNKDINPEMHKKLYRFLVMPREQHAEKTKIQEAMKDQEFSPEEIKKIWK